MPNIVLVQNEYKDTDALQKVIDYALRGSIIGGYGIDPNYAFNQMYCIKSVFHKTDGVQLKHFIISFCNRELLSLDFNDLLSVGFRTGTFFKEYQLVYGIHLDTQHVHMHCVMNTVSFRDGHKFCDGLKAFYGLCCFLNKEYPNLHTYLRHPDSFRI